MKKKIALLLALSTVLSMSTAAFAADPVPTPEKDWGTSSEVTGNGDVKDPVISYVLPTDLNFALDAFGMGDGTGSQVYSPEFKIINQSEVAIKVDVKADVTLASGVTLKGIADVKTDDPAVTDKDLYMELVAQEVTASSVTAASGTVSANSVTADAITYDPADADYPGAVTAAKAVLGAKSDDADYARPIVMTLALEKATYDGTKAPHEITGIADKTGAAVLRFAGTINPNATWVKNTDVVVKAVFDVRGLTSDSYGKLIPASPDVGSAEEMLKKANVASVGGGSSSSKEAAVTISTFAAKSNIEFTVVQGTGDDALTTLKSATMGSTNIKTFLTFNPSAGTLVANSTLKGACVAGTYTLVFETAGGTDKTFTLTQA